MSTGLKANVDGSAAIQVGGTDVITLTSGGAATFVTSPTTVQAGTAAAPSITFSGDTNTGIYSPGADTIAFTEGGVESMRIDSAGNVGIGTTSPDTRIMSSVGSSGSGVVNALRLQNVGTTIGDGARILFTAGTSTTGAGIASTGVALNSADLRFYTGGSNQNMTLNASGYLGLGETNPVADIDISKASGDVITRYRNGTGTGIVGVRSDNSFTELRAVSNHGIQFSTNNTERARIDSSGNLFVGTTNSGIGTARVNAWSDGTNTAINVASTGNGTSAPAIKVYSSVASGATNGIMCQFLNSVAGGVGSITSNGTSTAYNPSSDGRLKENIQLMTDGLSRVMKLKPVTYNWKVDGSSDDGFIAQDLQEIPEFANRVNPVGERDGEMYYGVDYMRFVSVLTAAIQEQQAMIDELKAKVAALEGA